MYVETNLIVAHTYIHTRSFLLKIAAQGNAEKGRRGKLGKWGEFFPSQKILSRGNVRRWSGKGKLRSIFFFNKLLCIKGSHFVTKVFRKWLCESSFFERKRRSCTTAWHANRNCRWILIGKMKKWIHLHSIFYYFLWCLDLLENTPLDVVSKDLVSDEIEWILEPWASACGTLLFRSTTFEWLQTRFRIYWRTWELARKNINCRMMTWNLTTRYKYEHT